MPEHKLTSMVPQLVSAIWTAGVTVVVVFVVLVAAGFWLLARRKMKGQGLDAIGARQQKANILLVRVDDAVKSAEDELGFALAQFGDDKAREFEKVLVAAKSQLSEAFGLQQKLDDANADTEAQRRDWNARIIHLCESARSALAAQETAFAGLRQLEKNAPASLAAVRKVIAGLEARMTDAQATREKLKTDYIESAIATVTDNVTRTETERRQATAAADEAQAILNSEASTAASSTSAADAIRTAEEHAHRAAQLLDAIDTLQTELGKASDAVTALRESTQKNLAEARALRDAPPDADASAAVGHAIGTVEAALATHKQLIDPIGSLEILRAANAELDTSMAGARNQQRRLDGARTALVGALAGARSQLSATRDFITTRRGGVGPEARTRIAEAERLLTIAETESDPVVALDTARSSATYSRDADALARYDLMGR